MIFDIQICHITLDHPIPAFHDFFYWFSGRAKICLTSEIE